MRIETREDALREIVHVLADYRQGKPVDFPQFLADLVAFLENDKTVESLEERIEELEDQIEELENQEPPITYSEVEAIEEPLNWAQHDLEDFRNFVTAVKADLPNDVVENIVIHLNTLQYDIDCALDKVRILIG